MKTPSLLVFAGALYVAPGAAAVSEGNNPIQTVLKMLGRLEATVVREGEESQKTYDKLGKECKDRSKELEYEIKMVGEQVEVLNAAIEQNSDRVDAISTKIEELSSKISVDEADLKTATDIRNQEKSHFDSAETEIQGTINTLERAIGILEKEGGGAALLQADDGSGTQLSGAEKVARVLSAMVDASALDSAGSDRLTALLQNAASNDDSLEDEDSLDSDEVQAQAPAAASYEKKSQGVVETLENLLEESQQQLAESRDAEADRRSNFDLVKQGLEDKIKSATSDLDKAKGAKAEAAELKATAEGSLSVQKSDLSEDKADLQSLHSDCMGRASDYEEEMRSRGEEMKALAEAKKVISEATGGAEKQTYGEEGGDEAQVASFLQTKQQRRQQGSSASASGLAGLRAMHVVRQLARKQDSGMLAQLASRIQVVLRRAGSGVRSGDVFDKVRGMISQMLDKLTQEGNADAAHKAFCDKALSDTEEKQDDKGEEVEKLTSKIDTISSRVAELIREVAEAQRGLSEVTRSQAHMDEIRLEEKTIHAKHHEELEEGITGVQKALRTLRDYYSKSEEDDSADHEKKDSAGNNIISTLEIVESDFTRGLADGLAEEDAAVSLHATVSQENEILKKEKEQAIIFTTKDKKAMQKTITELSRDRDTAQTELDAILEYMTKVRGQCIAKADPYEEKKKKREAEIAGLKVALEAMTGEASLLQVSSSHSSSINKATSSRKSKLRGVGAQLPPAF